MFPVCNKFLPPAQAQKVPVNAPSILTFAEQGIGARGCFMPCTHRCPSARGGSRQSEREAHSRASCCRRRRVLAALAGSIQSAVAAGPTLTIWADQDRKDAVTQLAQRMGRGTRGVTVNVVVHDFGKIRDDLGTVDAADAPDVIIGARTTGPAQLAANGLVEPHLPERSR